MFQFPNWSLELPGHAYSGDDPDSFSPKDAVRRFIQDYAEHIRAPVRENTNVLALRPATASGRYVVCTERGDLEARNVVVATGPYQRPRIPRVSSSLPRDLCQLHASEYRNQAALPAGAVLVVGSGASGCQIADELLEAGRRVYLCVGLHTRIPRRYRGKDALWWLFELGWYDTIMDDAPEALRRSRFLITGVRGGYDVDLRRSADNGMVLLGRLGSVEDGRITLLPDLEERLREGDEAFAAFIRAADDYVTGKGLSDLAASDEVSRREPARPRDPILNLDIRATGIKSVIWATGYSLDFGWVELPIFDAQNEPVQRRGVTSAPGIYFLGLKRQYKMKSSLLSGVGEDAAYLAEYISGGGDVRR
jgi:putative flavoprotein involved in K+ transport